MRTVLGAIHDGSGAAAILTTTRAIGELLAAAPRALHIRTNDTTAAREAAADADVPLDVRDGPVVEAITAAAERRGVVALAVGARGGRVLAGHTALRVMTTVRKPLVLVPPVVARTRVRRVVVALEGTRESADAVAGVLDAARERRLEIVLLHVHPLDELPLFEDQPVHEHEAWTREFMTRWCPTAGRDCQIELRVGVPGERLVELADEADADLIALSWSRNLAPGHAAVVREAVARGRIPTLLVPILAPGPGLSEAQLPARAALRPPGRR